MIFFAPLLQGKERRRGVGVGDAPEYLGGVIVRGQGRPRIPGRFLGVRDAPEYLGGVILRGQGRPRIPGRFLGVRDAPEYLGFLKMASH